MRLTAFTLTLLSATTFSGLAFADDATERPSELQVLDRFLGTWDENVTIKPTGGEQTTIKVVSRRRWTVGGTFLQIEDANNLRDPQAREFQLLYTYDPVAKNYPAVVMDGPNRGELTGTWDENTTTMHWTGMSPDGGTSKGYHRFIGKDRAEASGVFKDADGNVVLEISWPQTRRAPDAKAKVERPADLGKDDPLEPLNRRVGTWVNKNYHKKAEWTPEAGTITGEETIKWVLDRKFIQVDTSSSDGNKGRSLLNYDPYAKVYRTWFFDNRYAFPRGESIGRWDAEKERMDWEMDSGSGITGKMVFQFTGKDKMEWSLVAHDANGKLMLDMGGTQTRKGTAKVGVARPNPILPEDGAWARYEIQASETGNNERGTIVLRVVGTTVEDGQKCRWLEIEIDILEDGKKVHSITKSLVREKDLASTGPISILRGWQKTGDKKVTKVVDGDGDKAEMEMGLAIFFGTSKDAQIIKEERMIALPNGPLKVATATRGTTEFPGGLKSTRTFWPAEGIPFGFAAFDQAVKSCDTVVFEMQMTLKDHGTDAKSALPRE